MSSAQKPIHVLQIWLNNGNLIDIPVHRLTSFNLFCLMNYCFYHMYKFMYYEYCVIYSKYYIIQ